MPRKRCCRREIFERRRRPKVVFRVGVWRWRDSMPDVVDLDLLDNRLIVRHSRLMPDGCRRRILSWLGLRIAFIGHFCAITVHVVSGVLHDLSATVGKMDLVATMNGAVLLLLSVRKVVAGVPVFDCVREAIMFLVVVGRRRPDRVGLVVILFVNAVVVIGTWSKARMLELVVLYSSTVIRESSVD